MNKLRPPAWLTGDWEGSPHAALMRVDEDCVAIRLAETWNVKYSDGGRNLEIATPIHVNPTQVSADSADDQTYRLQAVNGTRYEGLRVKMTVRYWWSWTTSR